MVSLACQHKCDARESKTLAHILRKPWPERRHSALVMASATENTGVATEDTEEPQLAELLNQEAGNTIVIELKLVHKVVIDYRWKVDGGERSSQKIQVVLQSKIPDQYCLGVAKLQKKTKPSSGKSVTAGRQVPRGSSKPSSSSARSRPLFTPHATSQSIRASPRSRRCYRARTPQKRQCQQSPSLTHSN